MKSQMKCQYITYTKAPLLWLKQGVSLKSTSLCPCHPKDIPAECQDGSESITQNNYWVSLNSRIQRTPLIAMDRDCLPIKFTWYGYAEIYECGYVPVCKAGVMSIKIIIISIVRHFIIITFNSHNNLIKQVLTASFYKWGKWDSYKKYEFPRSYGKQPPSKAHRVSLVD